MGSLPTSTRCSNRGRRYRLDPVRYRAECHWEKCEGDRAVTLHRSLTRCHCIGYGSIDFALRLRRYSRHVQPNPARALPAISPVSGPPPRLAHPIFPPLMALSRSPRRPCVRPVRPPEPRRYPDRRIRLAPEPGRPRGPRVSGAGEPVHRRRHEAHGGAADGALRRDAGPDQGDRSLGARAARRLAVLLADGGRSTSTRSIAAGG